MSRILLVLGIVVLGATAYVQCYVCPASGRREAEPQPVSAAAERIMAPGIVQGGTEPIELRSEAFGSIASIRVREGQQVQEGDILFQLDNREAVAHVKLAEASVRQAQAELQRLRNGAHLQERREAESLFQAKQSELEQATLTWARVRQLPEHVISDQEIDDHRIRVDGLTAEVAAARANLEQLESEARRDDVAIAEAKIQAARAQLDLAEVDLAQTFVKAPSAGEVLRISVEQGELTGPQANQPAVVLVNTDRLRVKSFVDELDAPRVVVGMAARIRVDGLPGVTLIGRVTQLSPQMTRKALSTNDPAERFDTKVREVWIDFETKHDLVIGLRVDVVLEAEAVGSQQLSRESSADAAAEHSDVSLSLPVGEAAPPCWAAEMSAPADRTVATAGGDGGEMVVVVPIAIPQAGPQREHAVV